MKRNYITRALALLLSLMTLLSLAALPTLAAEDNASSETVEDITVTWIYNHATDELTGYFPDTDTTLVYSRLELPNRAFYLPMKLYEYENTVDVNGAPYAIQSPDRHSHLLCLDPVNGGDPILYATAEGRDHALNFVTRPTDTSPYLIESEHSPIYYDSMATDTLDRLAALPTEGQITCTLADLKNGYTYELWERGGEENALAVIAGYFYETDAKLYYLDATALSDACFDREGGLNPMKSVTVTLIPLDEMLTEEVYESLNHTSLYSPRVEYEDDYVSPATQRTVGVVLLYICMLPVGILLPSLSFAAGLVFPHLRAFGKKKRWYALTAISAAWILLTVLLLIIVTVAAILV